MLGFELRLLENVDVLRNSGSFLAVDHHPRSDIYNTNGTKALTAKTEQSRNAAAEKLM